MTLTKDEYLKASAALATGFGPTVDFADPQLGSTVQSEAGIPTAATELPGQVFTVDQLPNPAAAVAYGLPPVVVPAHLILDDDEAKHIQGKDALDFINGEIREQLGNPMLAFDNTVRSGDDALTSLSDRTGAGLGENGGKDTTADAAFVDGVKGGDGETTTGGAVEAPIDPAGVQKGDGDKEAVSAQAGTQGQPATADASGQPDSAADQDKQAKKATSR